MILRKEYDDYMKLYSQKTSPLLEDLETKTYAQMEIPQMLSGALVGNFLKYHIQMTKSKKILEIGTFTGFSALMMAEALEEDAMITSMDSNPKAHDFAQSFVSKSAYKKQINLILGDAQSVLQELEGPFDLIFIDADKENYLNYYHQSFDKVKSGGFYIFDNALWGGEVLNPSDKSSLGIHKLNEYLSQDERVENNIFSIRDGLHIARKN